MTVQCNHEDFKANVDVNRMEDSGRFIADIRVECTQCGTPFHFVGVNYGLSFSRPALSADGCELHIPLMPGRKVMQPGDRALYEMPGKNAEA